MPFPTDHPHVHANRLEAQEPDDKGACYLERIDADRIIVKVRSPRERNESSVSIPWDIWLKMIADHRRPSPASGTFWTVEYFKDGKSQGYWDGGHCESKTTEIEKAIQFHRRDDAMWASMGWHVPREITEHVMLPNQSALQEKASHG